MLGAPIGALGRCSRHLPWTRLPPTVELLPGGETMRFRDLRAPWIEP